MFLEGAERAECVLELAKTAASTNGRGEEQVGVRAWKDWPLDDGHRGNCCAHRYSRLSDQWQASENEHKDGKFSGDLLVFLGTERSKLKAPWNATECDRHACEVGRAQSSSLARRSADKHCNAAKTFRPATSSSFDAFHPCHDPGHLARLSDAAMETPAVFLHVLRSHGHVPTASAQNCPGPDSQALIQTHPRF